MCAGSVLAVEKLLEFPDPFWFSARLAWELRMDYGETEAHLLRGCQTAVLPPAVPLHSGYRQERSQGGLMRTGMLGSS